MTQSLKRLALSLTMLACGVSTLRAEDNGFNVDFKLRTGISLSSSDDHLTRRTLGAGLNFGYQFGKNNVSAELGYQYKPGDQYLTDVTKMVPAQGAGAPDPTVSIDSRRNSLQGVTLRFSYERAIDSEWSWRAGLQLGGSKYRHEYIGDISDNTTYEDTYNGTPSKTNMSVSPFVGVSYRFNPASSLELNLIAVSYKSLYNVHTPGADPATADVLTEKSQSQPHIELGYVFRF